MAEAAAATWERVAPGWEVHGDDLARQQARLHRRLADGIRARSDDTVLDLAAGPGSLSLLIAADLDGGTVICSDVAPSMVAVAERRGADRGVGNVLYQVLDVRDLDLSDGAVDVAVCSMGMMLVDDADAAFSEVRRVLRPGGRFAFATWGPAADNPWLLMVGAALLHHGHEIGHDPNGPGGVFSLSSDEAVRAVTERAGFEVLTSDLVDLPVEFPSFDAYWDVQRATSAPVAAALEDLDPATVDDVRATCREFCAGFATADGSYAFPGSARVTVAW